MNWLGIILAIVALIAVGCVLMGLWGWETLDTYPDGLQVPHLSWCRGVSVFPLSLSAELCVMLQVAVATAVAIIPEALLPVITLCLTLGRRIELPRVAQNLACS